MSSPQKSPLSRGPARLSVIVVAHNSAGELRRSLPAIVAELRDDDELIVCDNASDDGTTAVVEEHVGTATLIETGRNLGFGAACNLGAAHASGDLLLFLNPDNVVTPGFRDAIELPLTEQRDWAAWQGLVTDRGGETLNSAGGVIHFTGIAWAGGAGLPRAAAPAAPREVAFASGACLAVRSEAWEGVGGFSEPYFLYHEDTDLSLRLRLAGATVGIEPRAVSDHEYEFDKGAAKWRYLERNRWATIVRTYPGRLLLLLLPALIATELALLPAAAAGGWLPQKLRAWADVAAWLPRLLSERRRIQRQVPASASGAFADHLTAELDSIYFGRAGRSPALNRALGSYWNIIRRLL